MVAAFINESNIITELAINVDHNHLKKRKDIIEGIADIRKEFFADGLAKQSKNQCIREKETDK